jgi:hypothetical protein
MIPARGRNAIRLFAQGRMRHSERAPPNHTDAAESSLLGGEGALVAAIRHNLSTLLVLANAGRLLRLQEHLPRI